MKTKVTREHRINFLIKQFSKLSREELIDTVEFFVERDSADDTSLVAARMVLNNKGVK